MTRSSTSMRTSSRTNSGLPSVDAGSRSTRPAGQPLGAEQPGRERLGGRRVEAVEHDHRGDRPAGLGERRPHLAQLGPGEADEQHRGVGDPLGEVLDAGRAAAARPTGCRRSRRRAAGRPRSPRRAGARPRTSPPPSGPGAAPTSPASTSTTRAWSASVSGSSVPIAARAASASASSPSPAASRISCATGANVASPARSQRSSTLCASACSARCAHSSRDSRVLPTPGDPSTVASRALRGRRGVVEHADEPLHLRVASDERRRHLGLGVGLGRDLVDRDRLRAPGDGHLAERLVPDVAAGEPPRLLAHEHVAGAARLLEPGRDVERVADEVGVALADHDLAGVDADAERERLAVAALDVGRELLEPLLERGAGVDRAAGVVLGDLGDAEGGHHPVAHELGDGARVGVDRLLEQGVVAGEDLARDLGVGALTEAGGAAEIGEQDRDRLADRGRRRRRQPACSRSARCRTHRRTSARAGLGRSSRGSAGRAGSRTPRRSGCPRGSRIRSSNTPRRLPPSRQTLRSVGRSPDRVNPLGTRRESPVTTPDAARNGRRPRIVARSHDHRLADPRTRAHRGRTEAGPRATSAASSSPTRRT